MSVGYNLILPLILYLLSCYHGISETFSAGARGVQNLNYRQVSLTRQRERGLEMTGSARGSGAYSAETEQMRRNREMVKQMRHAQSRAQRIRF
ncbi:MAG: hypothetical protein ACYTE3_23395 [Planctomycetota bacterium]|jgi:hypothetical protein